MLYNMYKSQYLYTVKVGFGRSHDQVSGEPVFLAFTLEPANILAGSWINIRFLRNTGFF